jgi:hypothetical protein
MFVEGCVMIFVQHTSPIYKQRQADAHKRVFGENGSFEKYRSEMTPWFNEYTRPHWIGVYETRVASISKAVVWKQAVAYNYWNGLFWERTTATPERQEWSIGVAAKVQYIEFRGFTTEQNA